MIGADSGVYALPGHFAGPREAVAVTVAGGYITGATLISGTNMRQWRADLDLVVYAPAANRDRMVRLKRVK